MQMILVEKLTGLTEGSIGHKVPLVRPQKAGPLPSAIKPSRDMVGGGSGEEWRREREQPAGRGSRAGAGKKSLRQAKRAI